jgi:NADH:ubiquinone oxidoreductase subunit E
MVTIEICMGSSCFSRGNAKNLAAIRAYLRENLSTATVRPVGHLCQGQCSEGPNIIINGEAHHRVNPSQIGALLDKCLNSGGKT